MAEIVTETGVVRDPRFLYYVRGDGVWRVPRTPGRGDADEAERIATFDRPADPSGPAAADAYVYFLDRDGNVARVAREPVGPPRE